MLESHSSENLSIAASKKALYKILAPTNVSILFNFLGTGIVFPGLITQIPYLEYYKRYKSYVDPLHKLMLQTVWFTTDSISRLVTNCLK